MPYRILWGTFLAVVFVLAGSNTARAQYYGDYEKWEVSPFVGYETSGSYPITSSFTVDRLRINSGLSYGAYLDYSLTQNTQAELAWSRNNTTFSAHDFTTNTYTKAFDSDFDQVTFGFLYKFRSSEAKLRPFATGAIGFAHESNDNSQPNHTLLAYALGTGVKYEWTKHFGLRGDLRYMPSRANRTPGLVCDPLFGCFQQNVSNYLQRFSFTGGIALKF